VNCESIRPRGLIRFHAPDDFYDFFFSDGLSENHIVFRDDQERDVREEISSIFLIGLGVCGVEMFVVSFSCLFYLAEPFADLPLCCCNFRDVVFRESCSILAMEEGGVTVACLQPQTSGLDLPVLFLHSERSK
jgi:hypothetical protein